MSSRYKSEVLHVCWAGELDFIGYVGYRELKQMGIVEEVLEDSVWNEWGDEPIKLLMDVVNGSSVQGYLFRCLHCGKHLLWVDCD